jgi:hypothetical protein
VNAQPQVITFTASGGTGGYTSHLTGQPPFVTLDSTNDEITIQPEDCSKDPGQYTISLIVTDSAGDTGELNFTLSVPSCPA